MPLDKRTKAYRDMVKEGTTTEEQPLALVATENKPLERWPKFTTRDDLERATFDKKGKIQKKGAYRFFCEGNEKEGYRFIKIRNSGRGIECRLVHRIKTNGKNKVRIIRDKNILNELRKAGVPGSA